MRDRIRDAFDQIQAEEPLKAHTKDFLARKTAGYTRVRTRRLVRAVPALACFALLLLGGHWLYFTPTAAISIDINPSLELGVNRFDKVISVDGRNSDGQALAAALEVKYMDCTEAVEQILHCETVETLLAEDAVMEIGVIGTGDAQSERMLAAVESCTAQTANTYCYAAHTEEAEEAHALGLSCGKYRALRALQEVDPSVTADEVRDMSMREIRDRLAAASGGSADTQTGTETQEHHSGRGAGSGAGRQHANRHGAGNR